MGRMILGPWWASRKEWEEARKKEEEARRRMDAEIEHLIKNLESRERSVHGKQVVLLLHRAGKSVAANRTSFRSYTYEQGLVAGIEFIHGTPYHSLFLTDGWDDTDVSLNDVLPVWPDEKDTIPEIMMPKED